MKKINHIIFDGILEESYNELIKSSRLIVFRKGEIIRFNTEECKTVDLLLKGSIEVEHLSNDGDRLIVRIFNVHDVIGLNVTFSSNPYYIMNFVAREDVELLSFEKEVILNYMSKDSKFMSNILKHLCDNTLMIGSRIKSDFKITIRNQLNTYLLSLYDKQTLNPVLLPISKTKLAEYFGVSRTSISRELAKMEKEELILVDGKSIELRKILS